MTHLHVQIAVHLLLWDGPGSFWTPLPDRLNGVFI